MKKIILLIIIFSIAIAGCATSSKKFGYRQIFHEETSQVSEAVKSGNLEQGIRDASMLLEMDPKNDEVRFLRAIAYQKRNQFDKAAQDYLLLLKHNPNHAQGHYNLGMLYAFKIYNKQEALKHFDTFLTLNPKHQDAFKVAKIMMSLENSFGSNASENDMSSTLADQTLKKAWREIDVEKRKKIVQEAIKLDPTKTEGYFTLGQIALTEGKKAEAIKYFSKSVELKPTLAEAHHQLGQLLLQENQNEEARMHLIKASLFKPNGSSSEDAATPSSGKKSRTSEISHYKHGGNGSIVISTRPKDAGCALTLNGVTKSYTTPLILDDMNISTPIKGKVVISKDGYHKKEIAFELNQSVSSLTKSIDLVPQGFALIDIQASPWGVASIKNHIDSKETPVGPEKIKPGRYQIEVTYPPLNKTLSKQIAVAKGQHIQCYADFSDRNSIECD
ncbi:MAG: tetratricopeptide repeat protein [Pseudomonadota bacterium]